MKTIATHRATPPPWATHPRRGRALLLAIALGAALVVGGAAPAARAQDPDEPPDSEAPEHPPMPGQGAEDPMQKIARIIDEIEKHMIEAEKALIACQVDGAVAREQSEAARKLDELLRQAGGSQSDALKGIDELLEEAAKQARQSGGGGGGRNRDRNNQKDQDDQKDDQQQGKKPENQGQKDDQKQDQAKNQDGSKPPGDGTEKNKQPDVAGRWGDLPPDIRERIIQGKSDLFPPEYREKIEQYFKRTLSEEK